MSIQIFFRTGLCCLVLLCSACGGGGGGGSGGDANDPDNEPVELIPDNGIPLEYTGNTDGTTLTNQNVGWFIYAISGQPASGQITTGEDPIASLRNGFHTIHTAIVKGDSGKSFNKSALNDASVFNGDTKARTISEEISGRDFCGGGTMDYVGDIKPNGTGVISMQFHDCLDGGVLLNGVAYMEVHSFYPQYEVITHSTLSFKHLVMTVNGIDFAMSGSIDNKFRLILDDEGLYLGEVETATTDTVMEDGVTGKLLRVSDFVQEIERGSSIGAILNISGRIYHQDYGYADVQGEFKSDNPYSEVFTPLTGGFSIRGSDIDISASVSLLNEDILYVRLSSLGDSGYELTHSALLAAKRLSLPEIEDIADSDGDTMHNSWETHFGLNPNDRNDARADADGDSLTNIEEYLGATVPNVETDTEAAFSPIDWSLEDTGSSILPTNRQVRFDFDFLMNTVYVDTTAVVIRFPAGFKVDSIGDFDYSNSYCQESKNTVTCYFDSVNTSLSSYFADFSVYVTLPEEAGQYDLGVLLVAYDAGIPEETLLFTQTLELVPDFVDLEIELQTAADRAALDNIYRYTLVVRNVGTVTSEGINLRLTYSDDVQRVSGSNNCAAGVCTADFSFPPVAGQSSQTQHFQVYVPVTAGPQTIESSVAVIPGSAETNFSYINNENSLELIFPDSQMLLEARPYKNHVTRSGGTASWNLELGVFPDLTDHNGDYVKDLTITLSLPSGIEADTEELTPWCSASIGTVTCEIIGLTDRWAQSITIPLLASADGIYNYSATLTSAATDDPADNTVQLATYVGQPLTGIQALIDAADDGATVQVPPGYYHGNLAYTKNINLVSQNGPEQTFISSSNSGIQPGAAGSISGFTFTYGNTPITLNNSNVTVADNIFDHLNNNSDYSWGTSYLGFLPFSGVSAVTTQGNSQPVIERNIMRDTNCLTRFWGAFRLEGASAPTIRNNLVANSNCVGVNFSTLTPGAPVIVNNTFVNSDIGLWVPEGARTAGIHIGNNIIYGNNIGIKTVTDCGGLCNVLQSNLVYGNDVDYMDSPDQTGDNGNLAVDPMFTDAAENDFTLQAGSPAIDTGDSTNAPADDLLENPRPVDGDGGGTTEPDIGAYEFQTD